MSDDDLPNEPVPGEVESVVTLTDLIDKLEQRAFTRSLDERHPSKEASSAIPGAERA